MIVEYEAGRRACAIKVNIYEDLLINFSDNANLLNI